MHTDVDMKTLWRPERTLATRPVAGTPKMAPFIHSGGVVVTLLTKPDRYAPARRRNSAADRRKEADFASWHQEAEPGHR